MKLSQYNAFCASLPHTDTVIQWGGAHVWKIGGKVFAIAWPEPLSITFKAGDIGYEVLRAEEGYRPAPYFASRGMKWINYHGTHADNTEIQGHIRASYDMVIAGLTRKKRLELGMK